MAINPNIKKKADDIRNKIYGKEVRESLASGLEEMSSDVVENEGRQSVVEGRQDSVESQWQAVSDEMTDKDVISAPEIIAARNGEANLKARIDKDHQEVTTQLAHNSTQIEIKTRQYVNIDEFPLLQGETDDTLRINRAIAYCVVNKKTLMLNGEDYNYKGTLTLNKKVNIKGADSSNSWKTTKLNFTHTDNKDCIVITSTNNREQISLKDIQIFGNSQTGRGIYIYGRPQGQHMLDNVTIHYTGGDNLYLDQVYIMTFNNVKCERWDGKRAATIKNCNLLTFNGCLFNTTPTNISPVVYMENANSINMHGVNFNGAKGVQLVDCVNCNINGYHEIGPEYTDHTVGRYSAYLDEFSVANDINLQTTISVIDKGMNNTWKTSRLNNTIKLNPRDIMYNLPNCGFDETPLDPITVRGVPSENVSVVDVDEGGTYSTKALKISVPAGGDEYNVVVRPFNFGGNQGLYVKRKPNTRYTYGLSIKSDMESLSMAENNELYSRMAMYADSRADWVSSPNTHCPLYKDFKNYVYTFTTADTVRDADLAFSILFKNNTGKPQNVYITDLILTDDTKTMPKSLTNVPTSGTWLANRHFTNPNDGTVLKCTKSGTFGSLTGVTCTTTGPQNISVTCVGDIDKLKKGDFISIGETENRIKHINGQVIELWHNIYDIGTFDITYTKPIFA